VAEETITVSGPDSIRRFRARLRNLRPALDSIGAYLQSESVASFAAQRLGEYRWNERYPQQEEPFINIAGVLAYAGQGKTPRKFHFDRRPALVGTGNLRRSIAYTVAGPGLVEIGVAGGARSYGALHQFGGTSKLAITETTRRVLRNWLFTKKGKDRKGKAGYAAKLVPLLNQNVYSQSVYKRPFIGCTPENGAEIRRIVTHFLTEERSR
jgi:phage gpG-like protein